MNPAVVLLVISTIVGIYLGILMQTSVSSLAEMEKCPFCYGIDLCEDIERISLRYDSFNELFYNLFSVKNLFFAEYGGEKVVLKKLAHQKELDRIRIVPNVTQDVVLNFMDSGGGGGFKSCDRESSGLFLERLLGKFHLEQIWTILQVNVEPLILSLLQNKAWPVPKLHGSCGFFIVEQYCGLPLTDFDSSPWHRRAYLALQLLEAAIDFTYKHDDFRVYLTDISPDNIAIDDNFNLRFVDLESVVLKQKLEDNETIHYSEYFADEDFIYNEDEVCQSSISDHNVYAVCRLLLSKRAPWPMTPNGLLHSPPPLYTEVLDVVEDCVYTKTKTSRFVIAEKLIRLLKEAIREIK